MVCSKNAPREQTEDPHWWEGIPDPPFGYPGIPKERGQILQGSRGGLKLIRPSRHSAICFFVPDIEQCDVPLRHIGVRMAHEAHPVRHRSLTAQPVGSRCRTEFVAVSSAANTCLFRRNLN